MLSLDNQRRLVNSLGYPVMGTKGEIKVPPGNIQINAEGAIQVDGTPIGSIKVVEAKGDVLAFSADDGRPLWQSKVTSEILAPPAVGAATMTPITASAAAPRDSRRRVAISSTRFTDGSPRNRSLRAWTSAGVSAIDSANEAF